MEIIKDFENKLLDRRDILVTLKGDGITPNKGDVKSKIAKKFKAKEGLVIINKIKSNFGSRDVLVDVNIYKTDKVLKKLTPEHIFKRNVKTSKIEKDSSEKPVEKEKEIKEETTKEVS